jgi:Cys-rich four helix bundle protein (predicted Tat secretion target)
MNRRDVMAAGAAVMAVSTASYAGISHADHPAEPLFDAVSDCVHDGATKPLFDAASNCVKAGLVCIGHSLQEFAAGDTSLAFCARDCDQMLSTCGTLAKLASVKSPYLAAMAKVALAVCQDTEAECRKLADMHAECKACAEACAVCAAECKRVAA